MLKFIPLYIINIYKFQSAFKTIKKFVLRPSPAISGTVIPRLSSFVS